MSNRDEGGGFFSGLILGSLLGAGALFLFKTKEGRHLKKELLNQGKKVADDLPEAVEKWRAESQKLTAWLETAKKEFEKRSASFCEKATREIDEMREQTPSSSRRRFFVRSGKKLK